jgi:hypothetical protein
MCSSPRPAGGNKTPAVAGLVLVESSMIGFPMNVDFAAPVHGSLVPLPFFLGMGLSVSPKGFASGSAER